MDLKKLYDDFNGMELNGVWGIQDLADLDNGFYGKEPTPKDKYFDDKLLWLEQMTHGKAFDFFTPVIDGPISGFHETLAVFTDGVKMLPLSCWQIATRPDPLIVGLLAAFGGTAKQTRYPGYEVRNPEIDDPVGPKIKGRPFYSFIGDEKDWPPGSRYTRHLENGDTNVFLRQTIPDIKVASTIKVVQGFGGSTKYIPAWQKER